MQSVSDNFCFFLFLRLLAVVSHQNQLNHAPHKDFEAQIPSWNKFAVEDRLWSTCSLAQQIRQSRTDVFLIKLSVWVWFLSNLEWLLILEEDTDSPKECKALILTILSMINVILEKYEFFKAWYTQPYKRKWQTETETNTLFSEWLLDTLIN